MLTQHQNLVSTREENWTNLNIWFQVIFNCYCKKWGVLLSLRMQWILKYIGFILGIYCSKLMFLHHLFWWKLQNRTIKEGKKDYMYYLCWRKYWRRSKNGYVGFKYRNSNQVRIRLMRFVGDVTSPPNPFTTDYMGWAMDDVTVCNRLVTSSDISFLRNYIYWLNQ